ncbi:MAG: hypothetical protein EBU88_02680, partial [Acidobacteria bacterium]|nr:hypothetical protein [Acidobacteriota bacterium]
MKRSTRRWPTAVMLFLLALGAGWYAWQTVGARRSEPVAEVQAWKATLRFNGPLERRISLREGETIEISVGLPQPSLLPVQGRVGVAWTLIGDQPVATSGARKVDAYGVDTAPTANW